MFILISVVLSGAALREISNQGSKPIDKSFSMMFIILTVLLCFRFGQGTDYFAYEHYYMLIDSKGSLLMNSLYHGELGWFVVMMIAKRLGLSFDVFLGGVSLCMMLMIKRAIRRYSPLKSTSLLLLYPTFYLTYFFSAIRQGLVLSLFLGIGLRLLEKKKTAKYLILVLLMTSFHKSAIVLAVLPLVLNFEIKRLGFLAVAVYVIGAGLGYAGIWNRLASVFGANDYLKVDISISAIILRVILASCIVKMHRHLSAREFSCKDAGQIESFLYKLYIFGFLVFLLLSFTSTLSQRITMPLKAIEVVLIPLQFYLVLRMRKEENLRLLISVKGLKRTWPLIALLVVAIINVETVKNLNSYIGQGHYFEEITPLNYPYVSVFNKQSIYNYMSSYRIQFYD